MELTYKDYVLIKDDDRFDLYKLVAGKDKDGNDKPEKVRKSLGCSMRLGRCIEKIAHDDVEANMFDVETLGDYMKSLRLTVGVIRESFEPRVNAAIEVVDLP